MGALSLFQDKTKLAKLDPGLLKRFNEDERNIVDRSTVPSLIPDGGKWKVKVGGKEETLTKLDEDGEKVPVQVLRAIVIDLNPNRSNVYYKGKYDPKNPAPPDCWSSDGRTPDVSITHPQHASCEGCPMRVLGSAVDERNGKATRACSQNKFIAILPVMGNGKIWDQPLRLKLSITSVWDAQSPDLNKEGWYAFDQYVNMLRANGVHNTALVVTKLKFDPNVTHGKIIFMADDVVSNDDLEFVAKLKDEKKEEIAGLISRLWTPAGRDGVRTDEPEAEAEDEAPEVDAEAARKEAEKAAKKAAKKAAAEAAAAAAAAAAEAARKAAEEDEDEDEEEDEEEEAPAPAPEPKKTERKKKEAAPKVIDEKPTSKTDTPAKEGVPNDLAKMLGDWAST